MWSFAPGRYLSEKEVKVGIDLANVHFCSIKSNTQNHLESYVFWGLISFYTAMQLPVAAPYHKSTVTVP